MRANLSLSSFLNDQKRYCYEAHELTYNLVDSWNQRKKCITLFYVVDFQRFDVILSMFMLTAKRIVVDAQTTSWRFKIKANNFEILNDKKFSNCLIDKEEMYVILCADVTLAKDKKTSLFEFFSQLNEYQKLFDKKKTSILFKQDKENQVIDTNSS